MKDEQQWQKFMAIAGLHIVWRHPLVRALRMLPPNMTQHAGHDKTAGLDLIQPNGQQDAQLAHQARTGDAHCRQCMGLPGARPGPVEADAEGVFVGVHGRTIQPRLAKAI